MNLVRGLDAPRTFASVYYVSYYIVHQLEVKHSLEALRNVYGLATRPNVALQS